MYACQRLVKIYIYICIQSPSAQDSVTNLCCQALLSDTGYSIVVRGPMSPRENRVLEKFLMCTQNAREVTPVCPTLKHPDYGTKPGYLCKWKVREETSETHTAKWQSYPRVGSSSPVIFLTMHIVCAKKQSDNQCYLRNQFPQLENIALITASPRYLYSIFILAHYVIIAEKNPVVNVLVGFPWEGQHLICFDIFLCLVCFFLCMCVCMWEHAHFLLFLVYGALHWHI